MFESRLGVLVSPIRTADEARLLRIIANDLAAIDPGPVGDARHHPTLWVAWATLDRPEGGGLAGSADELAGLPDDELLDGVVAFLTWLSSPVDPTHPLVGARRQFGYRSRPGPLRSGGVGFHARCYLAWRRSVQRPTQWSQHDLMRMADLSAAPAKRRRVELTVGQISRCLDFLDREEVVSIADPARSRAWHAREKAALLGRVWGVLRAGEAIELRSDLEVTDYGLRVRLLQPKTGRCRWVRLPARGDRFCPVLALEAWLSAAGAAGYDLGGRLLPVVLRRRENGKVISTGGASERNNFVALLTSAGVLGDLDLDDGAVVGLHNLRSVLPTLAADAGHDLPFLQALGAWARGATPAQSYVARRDGLDEAKAMAELMEDVA